MAFTVALVIFCPLRLMVLPAITRLRAPMVPIVTVAMLPLPDENVNAPCATSAGREMVVRLVSVERVSEKQYARAGRDKVLNEPPLIVEAASRYFKFAILGLTEIAVEVIDSP